MLQFHVWTCYTTARGKACQRLTQERFVMVFDRLWLAVFHSCPPGWGGGGFLVRRGHGGLLHPWQRFWLLLRGRIKENVSEPVQGNNIVIKHGICETSPSADCCSLTELPHKCDRHIQLHSIFTDIHSAVRWYHSRAEITWLIVENWALIID